MPDLEMRPAEWLLMPDGRLRRVVTVGTELVLYDAWHVLGSEVRVRCPGYPGDLRRARVHRRTLGAESELAAGESAHSTGRGSGNRPRNVGWRANDPHHRRTGRIGTMLRPRLARPGRTLRLLDIAGMTAGPAEEVIRASVTDMDAMTAACRGTSAVIHLASISGEASWDEILQLNIQGTYVAFEAARRAGVPRVIFASSNHAVGFSPRESFPVPDYAFPAPDTYYGVAKVTGEGLAALYHYRYGLDTICIRILTCFEKPRQRAVAVHLAVPRRRRAAVRGLPDHAGPGFRVVYGVSANTRGGWVSLDEAEALGYEPQDDAEALRDEVIAEFGEPDPADPVFALPRRRVHPPRLDAEHLT